MIGEMESLVLVIAIGIFGLLFGSFAGAQVWRLRARQLRDEDTFLEELIAKKSLSEDEKEERRYLEEGAKDRKEERRQLDGLIVGITNDHSRCLKCQHRLAWYDLLPLLSWLSTGGRCRYCGQSIGWFEPIIEAGVAAAFVVSYLLWPSPLFGIADYALFLLWLVSIVFLAILFAYDAKWFLLPDVIVFPLIAVGFVMSILRLMEADNGVAYGLNVVGSIAALSGLYLLLWVASKGQWVGFGDVKLGVGLALILADWRLALLTLFLANFIGTLIVLPGMALGKIGRRAHIPFGPLLIVGAFIAMLVGDKLIAVYTNTLF